MRAGLILIEPISPYWTDSSVQPQRIERYLAQVAIEEGTVLDDVWPHLEELVLVGTTTRARHRVDHGLVDLNAFVDDLIKVTAW